MALKPAPLKSVPALICDWVELRILKDGFPFRLATLQRAWDTMRDTEDSDIEGEKVHESYTDGEGVSGADESRFLESVCDELADRNSALQDAYPFYLSEDGTKLCLKPELNPGCTVYLFCLLLSHNRSDEVVDGSWLPNVDHEVRNLFQACSTYAAAGQVEGHAISFGYPRPGENAPFLVRLREVYEIFGEGRVRAEPLPGASPSPKDEEIDVIAWKPSADGAPGMVYLLGQVASGHNWEHKSIKGMPIDKFHDMWFEVRPVSEPLASIFIPHEILPTRTGTRKDNMTWMVKIYGLVFDRRRLPLLAFKGLKLVEENAGKFVVERLENLVTLENWVQAQLVGLRGSGA